MKLAWLGCLMMMWGSLLTAGNQLSELNANSQYTVESVEISGADQTQLSTGLRSEMTRLVGENLDLGALDQVATRLRRELHVRTVARHVLKGTRPRYVKVVFELKGHTAKFDLSVPKFLYQSNEGWNGAVEATTTIGYQAFTVGLMSDADTLPGRDTGVTARYEDRHLGTDRLRFRFDFASFHNQWNSRTLQAAQTAPGDIAGIYRSRDLFQPAATVVLARPLTLTVGAAFQNFQPEVPTLRTQTAHLFLSTLRYHKQIEGSVDQNVDAAYGVRAASRLLDSDYVFVRQKWEARYSISHGRQVVLDDFMAGMINGQAPLFERFVLGNSSTLRGWNKWDLDPLGGSRVVANTLEYRNGAFQVFYDTGAVWDLGQTASARHSVGVGLRQGSFSMAVAFPLREGHIEPIFMVGMNY